MNPAAALDAVGAAQGPTATMQAMQALLVAMAATAEAAPLPGTAPAAQAAEALPDADAVVLPGDTQAVAATAQAQQGRVTLGQLAAEPAALRAGTDAAPDPGARPALQPAAAGGAQEMPRPAEALAVPVLLTALHSPVLVPVQRQQAPPAPPPRQQADARQDDDEAPAPAAVVADDTTNDAEAAALRQRLQRAGQADALADLARGRQVLLVQPQADGAAQALLLSARGLQHFAAHWWPGAGAAAAGAWCQWRVFRDGDPLFTRGLRSRSAGAGCLLLLGTRPLCPPPVADTGAVLAVPDRIRFSQALGGQWSLLLLVAVAEQG